MKTLVAILSLLLIPTSIVVSQNAGTEYGFSHIENLRTDGYDFTLLKIEKGENHSRMGYFKFRWKGDKAIRLSGFGFEKDGSFSVRFEQFAKKSQGQWKEVMVGYCGTGAQMFAMEPNKDYVFQIPLRPYEKGDEEEVIKLSGENISVISTPFVLTDTTNSGKSVK